MRSTKTDTAPNAALASYLACAFTPAVTEVLILLIDLSGSMDEDDWTPSRLQGAKDACIALLDEKLRSRPQDHVGIVSFADGARVEEHPAPVGAQIEKLKTVVARLETYGSTDIGAGLRECEYVFDGRRSLRQEIAERGIGALFMLRRGMTETSPARAPQGSVRRIILLSDGAHNGNIPPVQVAERLKRANVEIDSIGIGGARKEVDEELLKEIASRDQFGRPRYRYIGERLALVKKFEELAGGLRAIS